MTSFYACYCNYQYALRALCQITSLCVWSIANQPFTLIGSKFSGEWCAGNVLVWNEDDDILTDISQCIPGVVVINDVIKHIVY